VDMLILFVRKEYCIWLRGDATVRAFGESFSRTHSSFMISRL
jgi:hypothetical protein